MQEDRILEKLVHLEEKVDKLDEKLFGNGQKGIVREHEERMRALEDKNLQYIAARNERHELEDRQIKRFGLWIRIIGLLLALGQAALAWKLLAA